MNKGRLEAFSDGVIAIIVTIMVLELAQPAGDSLANFLELWKPLLCYLLSFMFVAIYWVNHHLILHDIEDINIKIVWWNVLWLFVLSFIPFTTVWVSNYPTSWAPVTIYFADMLLACITFHIIYYRIFKQENPNGKFKFSPRNIVSIMTYFLAAALGGFYPLPAFIIVAIVTLWWVIPENKEE